MPQDLTSGRIANESGRQIAKQIADYLELSLVDGSNECIFNGIPTVIKSAKHKNTSFGITKNMLNRITQVILACQMIENGAFQLYCIPIKEITGFGTKTRSKGASKGKVVSFRVSHVVELGNKIGEIKLQQ